MSSTIPLKKEQLVSYNKVGLFWYKNDKGITQIHYEDIMEWLHHNGYYKFHNEYVQVVDNIVTLIEPDELKRIFINEVEIEMRNFFYDKVNKMFGAGHGIWVSLNELPDNFIADTAIDTWFFFSNTAVRVSAVHGVVTIPYNLIEGYIWDTSIVKREFHLSSFDGSDAQRFVQILGGKDYDRLCKVLGYGLSRYKNPLFLPAIVLNEDIDPQSEGESQGRSGKGLLVKFIKQFRNILTFDGKSFKMDKTHKFQNLTVNTDIIFIDDVNPKFPFTDLFSVLSEEMTSEPKNQRELIIPFEKSPKVIITSNFIVGKSDGSTLDRKLQFSLVKHFSYTHKPIQEFNREFFHGWDVEEWQRFDNFICHCAFQYLDDKDKSKISIATTDNSKERQLIADTNREFIDMMDSILANNFVDFAPESLRAFGKFKYEPWQANMMLPKPVHSMMLFIDREKLVDKTISRTKLKMLTAHKIVPWLKVWAESRKVSIDTRFGGGLEVLVLSFENRVKEDVEQMPF